MIKKIEYDGGIREKAAPSIETDTRVTSINYINICNFDYLKLVIL